MMCANICVAQQVDKSYNIHYIVFVVNCGNNYSVPYKLSVILYALLSVCSTIKFLEKEKRDYIEKRVIFVL